jgi:hypothetical protein
MGDGIAHGDVVRVLVKAGDTVAEPGIAGETDKGWWKCRSNAELRLAHKEGDESSRRPVDHRLRMAYRRSAIREAGLQADCIYTACVVHPPNHQ